MKPLQLTKAQSSVLEGMLDAANVPYGEPWKPDADPAQEQEAQASPLNSIPSKDQVIQFKEIVSSYVDSVGITDSHTYTALAYVLLALHEKDPESGWLNFANWKTTDPDQHTLKLTLSDLIEIAIMALLGGQAVIAVGIQQAVHKNKLEISNE